MTAQVGTKYSALCAAGKNIHSLLNLFGKYNLTQEMIYQADMFLIQCILKDSSLDSFDEIRKEMFYKSSLKLDIEKSPPTSDSIRLHILRAYFQVHLWYQAVYAKTQINLLEYGYEEPMVTSFLYSLTKQIFSLMIFLFHTHGKNALVKQSANVGQCRFHVANIVVAKQKGNVQTHMIKNMAILITANIWKNNVIQFINNI